MTAGVMSVLLFGILTLLFLKAHTDSDHPETQQEPDAVKISEEMEELGELSIYLREFAPCREKLPDSYASCTFLLESLHNGAPISNAALRAVVRITDLVTTRQISLTLQGDFTERSEETITFYLPSDWKKVEIAFSSEAAPGENALFSILNGNGDET